jgi:hypothetical protein
MAHISVYTWGGDRFSNKIDKARCRANVHNDQGVSFHQCVRKAKVFDKEGLGWCTQHSPEKVAAQRAKQKAKWDAESAEWDRKQLVLDVGRAFIKAMEETADSLVAGSAAAAVWNKGRKKG